MLDHKQIYIELHKHEPEIKKSNEYYAIDYGKLYKTVEQNK